jgi:hypothetical protein
MTHIPSTNNSLRMLGTSVLVSMVGLSAVHAQTAP